MRSDPGIVVSDPLAFRFQLPRIDLYATTADPGKESAGIKRTSSRSRSSVAICPNYSFVVHLF
jgi:hypothetical protein